VPLHRLPTEDIRLACRQKLETCELWLRRLIHEELSQKFGAAYFNDGVHDGGHLFRTEIRTHAARRMAENPNRYNKPIDTLLFDHLIDTLCKHGLYNLCFSSSLKRAFPEGAQEARTFFSRLVPIRNALAHANPMSIHDAERVLCYCDDVIESLKDNYRELNMAQTYNAPIFTRLVDSLGHAETPANSHIWYRYLDTALRPGDAIRLEAEVDSSFDPDDYTVEWCVCNIGMGENGTGCHFALTLLARHVGEQLDIQVNLKSNREWHRHGSFDARMTISYRVLPPLE
jgi:hypothetical protein